MNLHCGNIRISFVQTSAEYGHSKNRWSLVSEGSWQSTHERFVLMFQLSIPSPVASLFWYVSQWKRAYLGVLCWNHTPMDHSVGCSWFLISFQVSLVLKTGRNLSVLYFHRSWSFDVDIFSFWRSKRDSKSFKRSFLCLRLRRIAIAIATVAVEGIPISTQPRGPKISWKRPIGDQESNQKELSWPFPTFITWKSLPLSRYLRNLHHIQEPEVVLSRTDHRVPRLIN